MSKRDYTNGEATERDAWKARHWYYHKTIESLVRFLVPSGETVLEIGCGTGDLLHATAPKRGLGIDLSSNMIVRAENKYPNLNWLTMDVGNLNLQERFDYIILSDLLGHLHDVENVLQNVRTVCTARTRIVITYFNYTWEPVLRFAEMLGLKAKQPPQHWLAEKDIENLLYLSGFEVVRAGKKLLMPFYIPVLSWCINTIVANLPLLNRLCLIQYIVARPLLAAHEKDAYSVSIIIPARNERGNIEGLLSRLPKFGASQEIIFIEGHSSDGTLQEIKRAVAENVSERNVRFAVQEKIGKADAVRKGFDMATGDVLMILDADMSVPPEELPKFYECIRNGRGELVNGSRLVYPMQKNAMQLLNVFANKVFSLAFSWLLGQRIKDTLCGTKTIFRTDYDKIKRGRAYFGEFDPFGDFDLILGAAKLNLKITDVPVHYSERTYGTTQIRRFAHGWLLLRMCLFAAYKLKLQGE